MVVFLFMMFVSCYRFRSGYGRFFWDMVVYF